jgi:hypothetical protein
MKLPFDCLVDDLTFVHFSRSQGNGKSAGATDEIQLLPDREGRKIIVADHSFDCGVGEVEGNRSYHRSRGDHGLWDRRKKILEARREKGFWGRGTSVLGGRPNHVEVLVLISDHLRAVKKVEATRG